MTDNRFLWEYDEALGFDGLCGIDEVGRGPLAGPVCAACVVLPRGLELPALNDSKKMTEKRREETYTLLTTSCVGSGRPGSRLPSTSAKRGRFSSGSFCSSSP